MSQLPFSLSSSCLTISPPTLRFTFAFFVLFWQPRSATAKCVVRLPSRSHRLLVTSPVGSCVWEAIRRSLTVCACTFPHAIVLGDAFCASCSNYRVAVPRFGYSKVSLSLRSFALSFFRSFARRLTLVFWCRVASRCACAPTATCGSCSSETRSTSPSSSRRRDDVAAKGLFLLQPLAHTHAQNRTRTRTRHETHD